MIDSEIVSPVLILSLPLQDIMWALFGFVKECIKICAQYSTYLFCVQKKKKTLYI